MQAETVSVPAAAGAAARQTADRPNSLLMRRLLAWYRPDAKGISRPKLLFTLLLVDIAVVVASALAVLSGIGQTGALLATAWGLALAIVVVTALRLQRGYSIQALRRARFQALQVAIVLATGLCILAGVGFLAGVAPVDRGPALGWIGVAFVGLVAVRVAMARLIEALAAGLPVVSDPSRPVCRAGECAGSGGRCRARGQGFRCHQCTRA